MIDFIFHIDRYLAALIQNFGAWSYLILFIIIFAETGLIVTPFLPGDSLLFAAGAFAAKGAFDIWKLSATLVVAAIIGDSVNYAVGKIIGDSIYKSGDHKFFKRKYIDRTHAFYEKHGGKTIVLARFVPIIRTFAPFVAGAGSMNYAHFLFYNITGGILWVAIFTGGGYYFGNAPVVRDHFSLVVFAIIFISLVPAAAELWRHYASRTAEKR